MYTVDKRTRRAIKQNFCVLMLMAACFLPTLLFAGSASVTNTVTTSSNSGGNISTNGQIVEGYSQGSVSVKTVIDGQVVEDYTKTSNGSLNYTTTVIATSSSSTITTVAVTGAATSSGMRRHEDKLIQRIQTTESATRESAPENREQSGEVESSAERKDVQVASGSIAVEAAAHTRLTDDGVATRVVRSVQLFIIKIISLFSW